MNNINSQINDIRTDLSTIDDLLMQIGMNNNSPSTNMKLKFAQIPNTELRHHKILNLQNSFNDIISCNNNCAYLSSANEIKDCIKNCNN